VRRHLHNNWVSRSRLLNIREREVFVVPVEEEVLSEFVDSSNLENPSESN
jgi:hypothetical protein